MCFSINDLDDLTEQALYLNDLNPHGLGKEMVLAGWQHNSKWVIVLPNRIGDDNETTIHHGMSMGWDNKMKLGMWIGFIIIAVISSSKRCPPNETCFKYSICSVLVSAIVVSFIDSYKMEIRYWNCQEFTFWKWINIAYRYFISLADAIDLCPRQQPQSMSSQPAMYLIQ